MKIGWNEYASRIKELGLAIYPDAYQATRRARLYVDVALIGEIGELANKIKKILRGDKHVTSSDLLGEMGGIAWYIAQSSKEWQQELPTEVKQDFDSDGSLGEQVKDLMYAAITFQDDPCQVTWLELLRAYHGMACLLKFELSTILEQNLATLQSRQERNALQGDGDNR